MELHKDQLPPDFNIEETFMYNDHSKEPVPNLDTWTTSPSECSVTLCAHVYLLRKLLRTSDRRLRM